MYTLTYGPILKIKTKTSLLMGLFLTGLYSENYSLLISAENKITLQSNFIILYCDIQLMLVPNDPYNLEKIVGLTPPMEFAKYRCNFPSRYLCLTTKLILRALDRNVSIKSKFYFKGHRQLCWGFFYLFLANQERPQTTQVNQMQGIPCFSVFS